MKGARVFGHSRGLGKAAWRVGSGCHLLAVRGARRRASRQGQKGSPVRVISHRLTCQMLTSPGGGRGGGMSLPFLWRPEPGVCALPRAAHRRPARKPIVSASKAGDRGHGISPVRALVSSFVRRQDLEGWWFKALWHPWPSSPGESQWCEHREVPFGSEKHHVVDC